LWSSQFLTKAVPFFFGVGNPRGPLTVSSINGFVPFLGLFSPPPAALTNCCEQLLLFRLSFPLKPVKTPKKPFPFPLHKFVPQGATFAVLLPPEIWKLLPHSILSGDPKGPPGDSPLSPDCTGVQNPCVLNLPHWKFFPLRSSEGIVASVF